MDENLNPIVATVPEPVLTPKPKSSRKVIIIISLVLAALLLGTGVYFYSVNINKVKVEPVNSLPEENTYFDLINLKEPVLAFSSAFYVDYKIIRGYLIDEKKPKLGEIQEIKELLQNNKKAIGMFEEALAKSVNEKIPTPEEIQKVKELLQNKTAFEDFERSLAISGYCGPTLISNENCNLDDLRREVLLKNVKASILYREGKSQEAMDKLFEILGGEDKHRQINNYLIAYLVSVAAEKIALTEIQKIIVTEKFNYSDLVKYLQKIKTYHDYGETLKDVFLGGISFGGLVGGSSTEGYLSEEYQKHFKSFSDNVDRPCGTDYEEYTKLYLIDKKTLKSTDGKYTYADLIADLNSAIKKRCEVQDLRDKIEMLLKNQIMRSTSTSAGGPETNKGFPPIVAEVNSQCGAAGGVDYEIIVIFQNGDKYKDVISGSDSAVDQGGIISRSANEYYGPTLCATNGGCKNINSEIGIFRGGLFPKEYDGEGTITISGVVTPVSFRFNKDNSVPGCD